MKSISALVIGKQWDIVIQRLLHQSFNKMLSKRGEKRTYQEQIFTWWFDERKSAREIQTLLAEQYGLEVHWSTITRFIKVRSRKTDPHERPSHLKQGEKGTDSPVPKIRKGFLEILMNSTPQELGRMADEAREKSLEHTQNH